ncbi:MAG: ATP-dependent DNA helicase RecQ [Lachnospiraceae bacterium]|nr:ATP-dependent DNA helicase RecQ [Lachnospiraceae bacterium]
MSVIPENKNTAGSLLPAESTRDPLPFQILKRIYGYSSFRPGQLPLIEAVLSGRDTLGILPTGGGKSICYQVPAIAFGRCTLVISPLIALMEDQTRALSARGISAAALTSALSSDDFDRILRQFREGRLTLLFVSPERLLTPRFQQAAADVSIPFIAVDEAHCISEWGDDFRPAYRRIPEFVSHLPARPVLAAFTASASPGVRRDICGNLGLANPFFLSTGFDRPNLYFSVHPCENRIETLLSLLPRYRDQCGMVYCLTRKTAEHLCTRLRHEGFPALCYHGGMRTDLRSLAQKKWLSGECSLMIATSAFGMGIDKPDVRFVIHYSMPADLSAYYQEAGRAGRDGRRSDCILLVNDRDLATHTYFIRSMQSQSARIYAEEKLTAMRIYTAGSTCLRRQLLRYFGEEAPAFCGNCSVCLRMHHASAVNRRRMSPELLKRLRSIRADLAAKHCVPKHKIFPDTVLSAMTEECPETLSALLLLEGASPVSCIKYGADFLKEIRAWNLSHPIR